MSNVQEKLWVFCNSCFLSESL